MNTLKGTSAGIADYVATAFLSLRAPEGSAAISLLSDKYEIASVATLPRNDKGSYKELIVMKRFYNF